MYECRIKMMNDICADYGHDYIDDGDIENAIGVNTFADLPADFAKFA